MAFIRVGGRSHGLPALALLAAVGLYLLAPNAAASMTTQPGLVFHVGGPRGWRVPDASTNYGWWAMNNRFHVGDELYFKYANDSVLVVDRAAFDACNATDPVAAFDDGATAFRLDRPGFFCFISGVPGHCEDGQRLVVRVMVHPAAAAPAPGPGPAQGPAAAAAKPGRGGGRPSWQYSGSASTTVAGTARVAVPTAAAVFLVSLVLMFH